jgi:hypothetical protein
VIVWRDRAALAAQVVRLFVWLRLGCRFDRGDRDPSKCVYLLQVHFEHETESVRATNAKGCNMKNFNNEEHFFTMESLTVSVAAQIRCHRCESLVVGTA